MIDSVYGKARSQRALASSALALVLSGVGFLAAPLDANAIERWHAVTVSGKQCCGTVGTAGAEVEVGELRKSAVLAKNIGDRTWERASAGVSNPVRLGTSVSRDRTSAFFLAGDWVNANRATNLEESAVAPQGTGSFVFAIRPTVLPGTYKEYFEPVAEGATDGWMGDDRDTMCFPDRWCGVHFTYAVRSQAPPNVAVQTVSPSAVAQGSPLTINTLSTDNVGLDRVSVVIDGALAQVDDLPDPNAPIDSGNSNNWSNVQLFKSRTFAPSFSVASLAPGAHSVTVTAYDNAGRQDSTTSSFTVLSDKDRDGTADTSDQCPTIAATNDPDGCPTPTKKSIGSYRVNYDESRTRPLARIKSIRLIDVAPNAKVIARCAGCPTVRKSVGPSGKGQLALKRLSGEIVIKGAKVTISVVVPRDENVQGTLLRSRAEVPAKAVLTCLLPGGLVPCS